MAKDRVSAAALDLGSNSFRLLIGHRSASGLATLRKQRAPVRLAEGLGSDGNLSPDGLHRALQALQTFRAEMDRFEISALRCCGTETFRRSVAPEAFLADAEKILGAPIEILSGTEEAELCSLGVRFALGDKLSFPCLIVDAGGGSTELILLASADSSPVTRSLPIGVVALAGLDRAARLQPLRQVTASIKKLLENTPVVPLLVGVGGSAGALAALDLELPGHDPARIQGHSLSTERIDGMHHSLALLAPEQRRARKGLEAGRENLIIPGLEIYHEVLATIGAAGMMVSDAGLLEGILLSITRTYPC